MNSVQITDLGTNITTSFAGTLGTLSFITGALLSGTLGQYGGNGVTFAGGGSFTIMANGSKGLQPGVLFTGTFQGPVSLVKVGNSLVMTATVTGTVYLTTGPVSGATTQLTVRMPAGFVSGNINISGGSTSVTTVPEPGTLGLLGSGLVGMATRLRRKIIVT